MDERRARIYEDLRGVVEGNLYFDDLDRAPYAFDAGYDEVDLLGAIAPRTERDVAAAVCYARERELSIHPRGAATTRGGGVLGAGLVLDLSQYLRRVIELRSESVVVQTGVSFETLTALLAERGLRPAFEPDAPRSATIGGLAASDAVGPRSLGYGSFAEQVVSARVVLVDGEIAEFGSVAWPDFDADPTSASDEVARRVARLARWRLERRTRRPFNGEVDHEPPTALERAVDADSINLARLFAGSHGTLGVIVEIELRTRPTPPVTCAVVLPFGRLDDAADAVAACLDARPTTCELFDWRSIRLAREVDDSFRAAISELAEAILVVEFEGVDFDDRAACARNLGDRLLRQGMLIDHPFELTRRADVERILDLRRAIEPLLMNTRARSRPVWVAEPIRVPPAALPEVVRELRAILKNHEASWVLDAHAGLAHINLRVFLDLADPADARRAASIACGVRALVEDARRGGRADDETPLAKAGSGEWNVANRELRQAFDPHNVFNPDRLPHDDLPLAPTFTRAVPRPRAETPAADSATTLASLAGPTPGLTSSLILPVLRWGTGPADGPLARAEACNGCGTCRSREPTLRMCPTFRGLGSEDATPRAQANLLRQVAAGVVDPRLWGGDDFKKHADLCLHCNLCRTECPAGVDVSSLMIEAKAAYVENHGLNPSDWLLSRVETWSRLASRLPMLSNALLSNGASRRLIEGMLGLSRLRRLPRVHRTPFVRRAARRGLTKPRPQRDGARVAFFVDLYANYYDQELAEAVVAVLVHAGVNVYVPPRQRGSGMPALVAGDIDYARTLALRNLRALAEAVRDGYTVVTAEPTAALMIKHEYQKLTDDLDAELVAAHTLELGEYLRGLDARGLLPEPAAPLRARVGYHQPCHLRALDVGTPGLDLLRRIPELEVEFIDRGCSGMAGTYGLSRDHFRTSLRAGRGLLDRLRDDDIELGATECGACRVQMEQVVAKRTMHPIKLLSLGYGLNPALRARIKQPKSRRGLV